MESNANASNELLDLMCLSRMYIESCEYLTDDLYVGDILILCSR